MKLRTNIILCLCVCAISFIFVRSMDTDEDDDLAFYSHVTMFYPKPDNIWFFVENEGFNIRIANIGPGSRITIGRNDTVIYQIVNGRGRVSYSPNVNNTELYEIIVSQIAAYGFNSDELILYVRDIYGDYHYIGKRIAETRYIGKIADMSAGDIHFDRYRWITPSNIEYPPDVSVKGRVSSDFFTLCFISFTLFYFLLNIAILRRLKVKKRTRIILLSRFPLLPLLLLAVLLVSYLIYSPSKPISTDTNIERENLNLKIKDNRLVVFNEDTLFLSSEKTYLDSIFYLSNIPVYDPATETDSIQSMSADVWAYNDSDISFRSGDIWYKIERMHNENNNSYIVAQKCMNESDEGCTIIEQSKPKDSTSRGKVLETTLFLIVVFWALFELIFIIVVSVALIKDAVEE